MVTSFVQHHESRLTRHGDFLRAADLLMESPPQVVRVSSLVTHRDLAFHTGGTQQPNAALALVFVRQQNLRERSHHQLLIITSNVLAVVSSMDEEEAEILMSENLARLEVSKASDRSGNFLLALAALFLSKQQVRSPSLRYLCFNLGRP